MESGLKGPKFGQYSDTSFTALEIDAIRWLDGFYQLEHLLATRLWVTELSNEASAALKFSALIHDAERFFPGGPSGTPQNGFDDPDYLFQHSIRSADIVDDWLLKNGAKVNEPFLMQTRRYVLRHEIGGNAEEDILQAADSLSFLSTFDWLIVRWVQDGHYSIKTATEKLDWMLARIRIPNAVQMALPHHARIVELLNKTDLAMFDIKRSVEKSGNANWLIGIR